MISKYVNKWFAKQQPEKNSVPPEGVNSISFEVGDNDLVKIKFLFQSNSESSAEKLGEFLYELTSGINIKTIVDLMIEWGKENVAYQEFVKNTIIHWFQLAMSEDSAEIIPKEEDIPLIKPTEFYKKSTGN